MKVLYAQAHQVENVETISKKLYFINVIFNVLHTISPIMTNNSLVTSLKQANERKTK